MTATEGSHKPEATASTDLQGSHHQSLQVTMKIKLDTHTGQIHMLTMITTKIDSNITRGHLIYPSKVTETHTTHIIPQNQYSQADHHFNNSSNPQHLTLNMSMLNNSELIGSLQNQIIDLHSQPLQQATLNSINSFNGAKKAEFATWAQSVENATRICNLDAVHIALSKLQGVPLKSAIYLEGKKTSASKILS